MEERGKKILFCVQLPPPVHGTSVMNRFLSDSKRLREHFTIRVLPLQFNRDLKKIRSVSPTKLFIAGVYIFRLIWALIVFRPKRVYYTLAPYGAAFYRDFLYIAVLKLCRKRILFHLHGEGVLKEARKNTLKKRMYAFIFRGNMPICLSAASSRDIREVFAGQPYIVNNGIPLEVSEDTLAQKESRIPISIAFFSNLKPDKGIVEFMQSLELLKQKKHDFRAVVIGGETKQISFETLRRLAADTGLTDRIDIKGPLFGAAKYRQLIRSDVMVLPTRNDNFPCAILEAMQSGLAVISSNKASIPEMIDDGQTGFIVEPGDIQAIADRLEYFIRHPDQAQQMGRAGRKKFLNHYTLEIFEDRMNSIFFRELSRKHK